MSKRIALKDGLKIDTVQLGNFARDIQSSSEHDRVDVSGFNATGSNEYLAGQTVQEVTVEFYGSYGASEVHATLWPIHRDREIVPFEWIPDQTAAVSATNPRLHGNVQCLAYSPGATRGEVDTFSVPFTCPDSAGLVWSDT